jgi:hypothetical protein
MRSVIPQTKEQRLTRMLDASWDILSQRIATGRIMINKEASLQLHYSSILSAQGELLCIEPGETFSIELESANAKKSIDITCAFGDTKAAIELKCFRKASNRAMDIDMYDVLRDLERLSSYDGFAVRKFICITDNPYYAKAAHSGHAGSVTIRDGTRYKSGTTITPAWSGAWKDKSRDQALAVTKDILFDWSENHGWYSLSITL